MEKTSSNTYLAQLRASGANKWDSLPDSADLPSMPDGFDVEKFNRGKQFFQKNLFSCTLSMMLSLTSGFSVRNLLDPLVFTGYSDTPAKALRRYMSTFMHLLKWHFGNVWDRTTQAYESVRNVRRMHNTVRRDMTSTWQTSNTDPVKERVPKADDVVWVSQYDMSLVQWGFMGSIVMYPDQLGIWCSPNDLSDYCYFWYGMGFLLGIDDSNNICSGSLGRSIGICKEIENDILIPALQDPPKKFLPMATAFIDGTNTLFHYRAMTFEACMALGYHIMGRPYHKLSWADSFRVWLHRVIIGLVKYCPPFKALMNKAVLLPFNTKSMM